ncbi:MAG TPA: hypothetical protein VK667_09765 [Ktedonobacteraceae bacterium]|nr:hypothetical protein [Ktedonobacteraceae bacterium]
MAELEAVEQVFGMPDTWTVRPVTFGEMDPQVEMQNHWMFVCGSCGQEKPGDQAFH